MTRKKTGRPLKYKFAILALDDESVYSPACIADLAETMDEYQNLNENKTDFRTKIRHTMARFAKNNGFPAEGDGQVRRKGQVLQAGWLGARWKATANRETFEAAEEPIQDRHFTDRVQILSDISTLLDNEFDDAALFLIEHHDFDPDNPSDRKALSEITSNQDMILRLMTRPTVLEWLWEYHSPLQVKPEDLSNPLVLLVKTVYDQRGADDGQLSSLLKFIKGIEDQQIEAVLELDQGTKNLGAFAIATQIAHNMCLHDENPDLPEAFDEILCP